MVAEAQMGLTPQHYLDQLPRQPPEQEAEYEEESEPLTVHWQDENGRDTVTVQGEPHYLIWYYFYVLSCFAGLLQAKRTQVRTC